MRMINADDLEQALREAGLAEIIKDDCSKCTSAWGVPIVDAEPVRHGRWIVNDNPHTCRCSCCENVELVDWALEEAKYCPRCGCKMDGGGYE